MTAAFDAQARLCRWLACCACGARPCDPAHNPSRGAGGRDGDTAPLCRPCHERQHQHGVETFQRERQVDLALAARVLRALVRRWVAGHASDYQTTTDADRVLAALRGCGPDLTEHRPFPGGRR